jgi:hypothetical protein
MMQYSSDRKVGGRRRDIITLISWFYGDVHVFSNSHTLPFIRFIRSWRDYFVVNFKVELLIRIHATWRKDCHTHSWIGDVCWKLFSILFLFISDYCAGTYCSLTLLFAWWPMKWALLPSHLSFRIVYTPVAILSHDVAALLLIRRSRVQILARRPAFIAFFSPSRKIPGYYL